MTKAPPLPEAPPAPAPESKTVKTESKVKPPAIAAHGWVVQAGAFSHPENAKRLQEELKQKGYPALLDPPNPAKGKTVRVEVGPYKDAAAAKVVQGRIENEFGIQGVVRKQ